MTSAFKANHFPTTCLLLGLLAMAGCSPDSPPPAPSNEDVDNAVMPSAGVVNLYSTRHYDSDKILFERFRQDTGIEVRVREAGAAQLLETMAAEGASSPADVILAADAGTLWRFKDAGLTAAIGSEAVKAAIPEALRDPDDHWTGLAKRYRVIAYDPEIHTADDVDAMTDLAGEAFANNLCIRSSSNIYNLSLLAEMTVRLGPQASGDWAEAGAGNFARDPQGGDTAQIEAVAAGACSAAIVNHYYWVRLAESGSEAQQASAAATTLSFADAGSGVHRNVTGAAMAANAPNPDNARALIAYMTTQDGQSLLVTETKEFPVVEGVALPAGLETLSVGAESDIPLARLGEFQAEAQRLYDRAGWN